MGYDFCYLCRLHPTFFKKFFKASNRSEKLQHSPYSNGGTPVLKITEQRSFYIPFSRKMSEEQKTDRSYQDDLIRNFINLIIPVKTYLRRDNTKNRKKTNENQVTHFRKYYWNSPLKFALAEI